MSSGHRTVAAFVTLICALVLTIAGLALHWPLWAWLAAGAALPVMGLLLAKAVAPRRGLIPREATLEPDLPIEAPPRQERRVTAVALPSYEPDYDFLFSATVRWVLLEESEEPQHYDPGGLAAQAVLLRAREFTARQPPERSSLVQYQLNGLLAVMEPDATGRLLAMAQDVSVTLADNDLARLRKLSNVRKDEAVWEHERNYERSKRAYLGEDVLKDPGSAVVWWLARHEERVESVVERIGLLAQLSAAANNAEVPEIFRTFLAAADVREPPYEGPVPAFLSGEEEETDGGPRARDVGQVVADWLGLEVDDPLSALVVRRLADGVRAAGRPEAAEDLLAACDPPDPEDPPDEQPEE